MHQNFLSPEPKDNTGLLSNNLPESKFQVEHGLKKQPSNESSNIIDSDVTAGTSNQSAQTFSTDLKEKPIYVSGSWKDLEARPFNPKTIFLIAFIITLPILIFVIKGIFTTSEAAGNYLVGADIVDPNIQIDSKAQPAVELKNFSIDYAECVDKLSAALIVDLSTGEEIFAYNASNKRAIASISKLITAYVAYNTYSKDQLLTVVTPRYYYGSQLGLLEGEFLTVDDLVSAILIQSSNDAAYILADNYPGGYNNFIAEMNNFASSLGLTNTNFANPVGLDDSLQYSSAADVVKILNVILNISYLRGKLETSNKDISVYTMDGEFIREINLTNINELLIDDLVDGGKTGYTGSAGGCLVSYVGDVVYVVLGSYDRFESTKCLLGVGEAVSSEAVK
ncbi:D-alanyl-D-alanine carboxypeptidase [Candidatus Dojkabacteria bacterium]|nr:D-alanyl-D-alanine carboxypeptidase [Candidatus Dojkabacteria bacterium]